VRLFTGVSLPREVTENLTRLLDYLRPSAQLRWCAAYNLHITTKFIGEWPEERLKELISQLENIGVRGPIDVSISGIGWLPNPHSPRVLFAGIKAGAGLAELAKATEEVTSKLGIAPENRAYKPHLTLARIQDSSTRLVEIRQRIASLESTEFGSFRATCFKLYLSKLGPAGSIYTQLAEFPLAK
jgi:2'-5' RNA ligase